ncbi:MAG: glycine--tRNA ligase subunit beta [Acidobacteria bacterium]|nr:glycine--tRNA ligase subunit beta [Acidobacteriota bacterium]
MKTPKTLRCEPLLIEVGSEEIPARFLAAAEESLGQHLEATLRNLRLLASTAGPVKTFSTPRRLVAWVPEVLFRQMDETEEIVGPPIKVAFDEEGKPTRAAESFAQKNGVPIERLVRVETPKGLYLAVRKSIRGRFARELLAEALPEIVLGISFPKSMYWTSKTGPRFIRPIRWLLALQGEGGKSRVIPFEIAGVPSRNFTYGHRVAGAARIRVHGFEEFVKKLAEHQVELDPQRRRERVERDLKVLLEDEGLSVLRDPELADWVVNSTEWPRAILGGFDQRFLGLPREILVTVMRDHQKYFAVEDGQGSLQPKFVAVMNLDNDAKGLIREGHERVLTARFADAEFFWKSDQKRPLRDRLEMLERVTYQAQLGSYADKVRRMETIAQEICSQLEGQGKLAPGEKDHALRAVRLCKCDLTTQMVGEFPELQGVVGGLYARAQGEAEEVARAIYDHYKPVNVEDDCPGSTVGAVVSLADKLDSVVAGFAAGLQPSGSSDPFGLRRAGNGIIKIAVEALPTLDLKSLIGSQAIAAEWVHFQGADSNVILGALKPFLEERLEFYLRDARRLRYDTVRAVMSGVRSDTVSGGPKTLAGAVLFAEALERVRDTHDFQSLAAAAKRTRNILEKSAKAEDFGEAARVDAALFGAQEERDLYEAYDAARTAVDGFEAQSDYASAFLRLAQLRPVVDRFFDKVLVMDPDLSVRANRLRLLAELMAMVFSRFADLSQIESTASTSVGAPTSGLATTKPER